MRNLKNITVIFLFSLTPLLWFKPGMIIAGGDAPLLLNPVSYFQNFARYPVADISGVFPFEVCLIIPLLSFYWLLHNAGFSLILIEKIMFVAYFFVAGISMHYMMSAILDDRRRCFYTAKLFAALFYMFNYFVMIVTPMLTQFAAYALLPLILGLYARGLRAPSGVFRRSLLFAASLSFLPVAYSNPPFLTMMGLTLLLYTLYDLIVVRRFAGLFRAVSFILASGIIYAFLNCWLILVWYVYFSSQGGVSETILPAYWNPGSTLNRTFVLHGSWAWNDIYFPYIYDYFEKTLFRLFVYLLPVTVFSALLIKQRRLRVYFFVFLSLAGIFLAKGRWGLMGGAYAYMFDHFPMFWMFREPHAKFTVFSVLAYAVLLGLVVSRLLLLASVWMRTRRVSRRAAATMLTGARVLAVCCVCYGAWPIFTGEIIFDRRGDIPGFHVKVPDYWTRCAAYFGGESGDFRIFELPENVTPAIWLGWDHGFAAGGDPVRVLFSKSTVTGPSANMVIRQSYHLLRGRSCPEVHKLFDMLNVKYVLQRNDYLWKTLQTDSPDEIRSMLAFQEKVFLKETFGRLDIYEVATDASLFAASSGVTGVFGGPAALEPAAVFYDPDRMGLYFFRLSNDGSDAAQLGVLRRLLVFNSSLGDMAKCFVDDAYKIVPSRSIRWGESDCRTGWVTVGDLNKDPLTAKERRRLSGAYLDSGVAVFTASDCPLRLDFTAAKGGTYAVFARIACLTGSKGIAVVINSTSAAVEPAGQETDRLAWYEAGTVQLSPGKHVVEVRNRGGRTLVDQLLLVPAGTLARAEAKFKEVLLRNKVALEYVFKTSDKYRGGIVFDLFKEGSYRVELIHGRKDGGSSAALAVDGVSLNMQQGPASVWYADIALDEGRHTLDVPTAEAFCRIYKYGEATAEHAPPVSYERFGSSRYRITPGKSVRPFYLKFKNPYDRNWELFAVTDARRAPSLKDFDLYSFARCRDGLKKITNHLVADGYANLYYIGAPRDGAGYFILENRMQRVFELGVFVSLSFLAAAVLGSLFMAIRSKIRRGQT